MRLNSHEPMIFSKTFLLSAVIIALSLSPQALWAVKPGGFAPPPASAAADRCGGLFSGPVFVEKAILRAFDLSQKKLKSSARARAQLQALISELQEGGKGSHEILKSLALSGHIPMASSPVLKALLNQQPDKALALIKARPQALHEGSLFNLPPFFIAVILNEEEFAMEALEENPALAHLESPVMKERPLSYAYHFEMAEILLEANAEVNHQDKKGYSALMRQESLQTAGLLISSGADVHQRNQSGKDALGVHKQRGNKGIAARIGEAIEEAKAAAQARSFEEGRSLAPAPSEEERRISAEAQQAAQQAAKQEAERQRAIEAAAQAARQAQKAAGRESAARQRRQEREERDSRLREELAFISLYKAWLSEELEIVMAWDISNYKMLQPALSMAKIVLETEIQNTLKDIRVIERNRERSLSGGLGNGAAPPPQKNSQGSLSPELKAEFIQTFCGGVVFPAIAKTYSCDSSTHAFAKAAKKAGAADLIGPVISSSVKLPKSIAQAGDRLRVSQADYAAAPHRLSSQLAYHDTIELWDDLKEREGSLAAAVGAAILYGVTENLYLLARESVKPLYFLLPYIARRAGINSLVSEEALRTGIKRENSSYAALAQALKIQREGGDSSAVIEALRRAKAKELR